MPGFVFSILRGILRKNGNESDAERAPGNEIVQKIGEREGGDISVRDGVGADLVREGPIAQKTEEAAEQNACHDNTGGLNDFAVQANGHENDSTRSPKKTFLAFSR